MPAGCSEDFLPPKGVDGWVKVTPVPSAIEHHERITIVLPLAIQVAALRALANDDLVREAVEEAQRPHRNEIVAKVLVVRGVRVEHGAVRRDERRNELIKAVTQGLDGASDAAARAPKVELALFLLVVRALQDKTCAKSVQKRLCVRAA